MGHREGEESFQSLDYNPIPCMTSGSTVFSWSLDPKLGLSLIHLHTCACMCPIHSYISLRVPKKVERSLS